MLFRSKEKKAAQAMLGAFNDSNNSFVKFGDIFKYNIVDSVDKEGKPIKTKQIVLDQNGNPVYDYDKIMSVALGQKLNSDMYDASSKEFTKYKQELLRMRAFADLVVAHENAGLGKTLMSKLDRLETADPVDLAKLGFIKDENFKGELEKYKGLASEILKQNKAITDNIIFRNTSLFNKKNEVDNNRRAKLVEIVSNNVVNKAMAYQISSDLQTLKSKLLTDDQTHLSDGLVDQLNESLYRIESQELLIKQMKENGADKILPIEVYEKGLATLKQQHKELLKDNKSPDNGRDRDGDDDKIYTAPRLSEIAGGTNLQRKIIPDISRNNAQDDEDLKRELLFKFDLLRKSYKNANIPEFTIHSDYSTMQRTYDSTIRQVNVDSNIETYKS